MAHLENLETPFEKIDSETSNCVHDYQCQQGSICISGKCRSAECSIDYDCKRLHEGLTCVMHSNIAEGKTCQRLCNEKTIYTSECGVHQICINKPGYFSGTCVTPRCHEGAQVLRIPWWPIEQ